MQRKELSTLVVAGLLAAPLSAGPLVIEPDDFAPGADISNLIPGVALSTIATDQGDASVFAIVPREPHWASTDRMVFGHGGAFPEHWVTDTVTPFRYGALRIDIDLPYPVNQVQLDLNGNDSGDIGLLEAFAADGTLLGSYETATLDSASFETATINSATPISYVIAGGKAADTVTLDRLVLVPEPTTIALIAFATLALRRTR